VTNPTAVKYLREMKAGTKWIFYHTGDERTAVGTGTVVNVDATNTTHRKVKAGSKGILACDQRSPSAWRCVSDGCVIGCIPFTTVPVPRRVRLIAVW